MATTMQDVARYAAVSTATVSRALNKPELVDEDTRQRVLEAVRELGYRIYAAARTLRTRRTQHLAVVVDSLTDPLTVSIIEHFEDTVLHHDYTVQLYVTQGKENRLQLYLRMLTERGQTDGVLWMAARPHPDDLRKLAEYDIPVVMLNVYNDLVPVLEFDFAAVAYEATRYLMEQGHSRIGLIVDSVAEASQYHKLSDGYRMALEDVEPPVDDALIIDITKRDPSGWSTAIRRMFSSVELPTALVTCDDRVAAQVYQVCAQKEIRVPQEMSIIGVGDLPISRFLHPMLTTVQLPTEHMGALAFKTLQNILTGKPAGMDIHHPPPQIIERDSVLPR